MERRITYSCSLPTGLVARLDDLTTVARTDLSLVERLGLNAPRSLKTVLTDDVGLTREDYDELRAVLHSQLDGKSLISYGYASRSLMPVTRKLVRTAQRRNTQIKSRASKVCAARVNASRVAEALITIGLKSLELQDASAAISGRKGRNARKAA